MMILTNKEQIELMVKIKKLNTLIVNSNIDCKAYDLLADIGTSVLDKETIERLLKLKEEK